MAGVRAPKACRCIENGTSGHVIIVHVFGASDEAGTFFEGAIGREAHEKGLKIVGRWFPRCRGMALSLIHSKSPDWMMSNISKDSWQSKGTRYCSPCHPVSNARVLGKGKSCAR